MDSMLPTQTVAAVIRAVDSNAGTANQVNLYNVYKLTAKNSPLATRSTII